MSSIPMTPQDKNDLGYFVPAIGFISKLAIAVHLILLVFNLYTGAAPLSVYNFTSIIVLLLLVYWLYKDGSPNVIFGIILLKILLDSIFAAFLLGKESASLYYIIVLPIIFLVHPKWGIKKVLLFFVLLLLIFFTSYLILFQVPPVLIDSTRYNELRKVFNIVLISLSGYSILLFIKHTTIQSQNSLISTNEKLEKSNKEVKKQYRKQELLLKEMHHRVKNNLQLISSMMNLQKHRLTDKVSISILENTQSRIQAISLIHQKLFQQEEVAVVNMNFYLQDLVSNLQWLNNNIACEIRAIDLLVTLDKAVPLGLITAELLNNSFKHAFKDEEKGYIKIELRKLDGNIIQLSILDSGRGFKSGFNPKKSKGLGMEIILTLSEQIRAKVNFIQPAEKGALSTIEFEDDGLELLE